MELISNFIKPWLSKYPLDEENTSFVIKAWLKSGGEPEIVASFVMQWLEKYHQSFEATYVIKAWLKRTWDAASVSQYAQKWLLEFKDHPLADFVIKRFCRFKDIPDDFLEAAVYWCKKYSDDSEVLFALKTLAQFHITRELVAAPWLLEVLSSWIAKENLNRNDLKNLENIMYYTTRNKDFCNSVNGIDVNIQWFLSLHSFLPITLDKKHYFLQRGWYFDKYAGLLTDCRIDIGASKDKVEKFLNWVNGWAPENKKKIRRNLNQLSKTLPQHSELWQLVEF